MPKCNRSQHQKKKNKHHLTKYCPLAIVISGQLPIKFKLRYTIDYAKSAETLDRTLNLSHNDNTKLFLKNYCCIILQALYLIDNKFYG